MPIKINGATSGSTTITAPDTGSDESIELSTALASKVDYALPVNAQTGTTYTFVAADAKKLTTASNAAAVTLTIPPQSSVTWSDNTVLRVVNYGAGAVTIDGGSGVTVTNTATTVAQYGAAVAIRTGSDAWTVVPFGGGDVPSATVSSPTATGQYTDGGGQTWDYYTFTASGTLTVDTAGFADVLVVGGGGGGGSGSGGGGGAGGYLAVTDAYLPAGTATVVVGAGGEGGRGLTTANLVADNGVASRVLDYYAVGGGIGGGWTDASRGRSGGSGGGGQGGTTFTGDAGGAGTSGQGNAGGPNTNRSGSSSAGSGGGGAGAAGGSGTGSPWVGGSGGAGLASSITGSSVTRGGGGGGGTNGGTAGSGGSGGGGAGSNGVVDASAGTANTGGGGGGSGGQTSSTSNRGGNGGSGVVIVRVAV